MRRSWKRRLRLAVTLGITPMLMAVGLVAAPTAADAQTSSCPSVGTNFSSSGPFSVTVQPASQHTYYSPSQLGSQGCTRHPVILWGNGTGASPSTYDSLLRHFASHGFIVAAANTAFAGSGQAMLAGLNNLTTFNSQTSSRFFDRVDLTRVGTTGHSQGGGGALEASSDSRVDTTFPLQPWLGEGDDVNNGATAFFMAGQNDSIVSSASVRVDFNEASHVPAAFGELAGASHFTPVGNGGGFRGAATAWARWQLMDDTNARGLFVGANCGLCTSSAWSVYETNDLLTDEDPPDPGEQECVTASNAQHVSAGRAVSVSIWVFAVGSGNFLGTLAGSSSLQETSPGFWEEVPSC